MMKHHTFFREAALVAFLHVVQEQKGDWRLMPNGTIRTKDDTEYCPINVVNIVLRILDCGNTPDEAAETGDAFGFDQVVIWDILIGAADYTLREMEVLASKVPMPIQAFEMRRALLFATGLSEDES